MFSFSLNNFKHVVWNTKTYWIDDTAPTVIRFDGTITIVYSIIISLINYYSINLFHFFPVQQTTSGIGHRVK